MEKIPAKMLIPTFVTGIVSSPGKLSVSYGDGTVRVLEVTAAVLTALAQYSRSAVDLALTGKQRVEINPAIPKEGDLKTTSVFVDNSTQLPSGADTVSMRVDGQWRQLFP